MSKERTDYRTAFVLFGLAVIVAMLFAFATTFARVNSRTAIARSRPARWVLPRHTRRWTAHQDSR
jgi:hypothetical protein